MGRCLRTALVAALSFALGPAHAALIPLTTTLSGAQEVPPTSSPATGFGNLTYDDVTNVLTWHIEFSGLTSAPTLVHFHAAAPPGLNAPVVFDLGLPASPIDGSVDFDTIFGATAELREAELLAGLFYVNVHTQALPAGEIRGQLQVVPEPSGLALLSLALFGLALRRR